MSGHIPLEPSNYTPCTPIYQQNFGDWSRLLMEIGACRRQRANGIRAANLQGSRVEAFKNLCASANARIEEKGA
jgi:hypothetical protein